jgi:hypothetical protein
MIVECMANDNNWKLYLAWQQQEEWEKKNIKCFVISKSGMKIEFLFLALFEKVKLASEKKELSFEKGFDG